MAAFNKVMLLGNLTRDPKLAYLPSQTAVVEIGIAVNRKWKDQQGNEKEDVYFGELRAFGKQAETMNKYLHKGDAIFVEGRLVLDTWEKDGVKQSKTRITVDTFQMLGAPTANGNGGGNSGTRAPASGGQQNRQPEPQQGAATGGDEDLPDWMK